MALRLSGDAAATRLTAPFALTSTGSARIVLSASSPGGTGRAAVLSEGRATSRLRLPLALGATAGGVALGRAYLGDVAAAAALRGGAIALREQRWFQVSFGAPAVIARGPGAVTALDVTLDYRGDALVAWQQRGAIWARELRANGTLTPRQRLGPSAAHPQLQALVSDDNRAIVAWAAADRSTSATAISVAISGPLVRFDGRPALLESYRDSSGAPQAGSLRLVRLSTEGVMLAWTGMLGSRHVVRAAAVGLDGVKPATVVSDAATDAVLTDLATGPHADAAALWTVPGDGVSGRVGRIFAARGIIGGRAQTAFAAPEAVGAGPARTPARIAIDPATGAALIAWPDGHAVSYAWRPATRRAAPARRGARAAAGPGHGAPHMWAPAVVVLGALVAALRRGAGDRRRRVDGALQ